MADLVIHRKHTVDSHLETFGVNRRHCSHFIYILIQISFLPISGMDPSLTLTLWTPEKFHLDITSYTLSILQMPYTFSDPQVYSFVRSLTSLHPFIKLLKMHFSDSEVDILLHMCKYVLMGCVLK